MSRCHLVRPHFDDRPSSTPSKHLTAYRRLVRIWRKACEMLLQLLASPGPGACDYVGRSASSFDRKEPQIVQADDSEDGRQIRRQEVRLLGIFAGKSSP